MTVEDYGIHIEFEFLPSSGKGFVSGGGQWMHYIPRIGETIQAANGHKWRVKDVIWKPWGQGESVHPRVKVVLDKRTKVRNG